MLRIVATTLLSVVLTCPAVAQELKPITNLQREQAIVMLKDVASAIHRGYYDPDLHHSDFDKRLEAAPDRIKQAKTYGECFSVIAWVVDALDDAHTVFIPPGRNYRMERGWDAQYIGNRYFVTAVKPGSDAEAKGLHPGDEIVRFERYKPDRKVQWKMDYYYASLAPQTGFRMLVTSPGQKEARPITVMSKTVQKSRVTDLTQIYIPAYEIEEEEEAELMRIRYVERNDVAIMKIPSFEFSPDDVANIARRMGGKKAVIFDLRGNGGGYEATLQKLLSTLFDHEVKIGDVVSRKAAKPSVAKGSGSSAFKGQVAVLVDARSASASELFARVVQLEKRGMLYGDRSAGLVMRAEIEPMHMGGDIVTLYGLELTRADLIMKDGKSLEKVGVTPDKLMLPTAEDLAAQRDPVLAAAAADAGWQLSPEDAGKMFPHKWLMH